MLHALDTVRSGMPSARHAVYLNAGTWGPLPTRAGRGRVALRCAGVRGAVALDDVYTAGRLVDAIASYLPEWPVGDAAELARASAAAYSSAYGALSASQSARDLVAADLTDDVRVCAQVDAVDIVAIAEPLAGGRASITAIA